MSGGAGRDEVKTCVSCGRAIHWRKKWERSWEQVRYCGDACRRRGIRREDERLEGAILERLLGPEGRRGVDPEEVGAALANAAGADADEWREWSRRAARRLVAKGMAIMRQGGREVDPSTARGPVVVVRAN
ncbi:MAG: DUF2256 domain-containing protein [Phycisphaerae bacterium]